MVMVIACDEAGTLDGPTARCGRQLESLHCRRLHLHPGRLRARPVSAPRPAEAAAREPEPRVSDFIDLSIWKKARRDGAFSRP